MRLDTPGNSFGNKDLVSTCILMHMSGFQVHDTRYHTSVRCQIIKLKPPAYSALGEPKREDLFT